MRAPKKLEFSNNFFYNIRTATLGRTSGLGEGGGGGLKRHKHLFSVAVPSYLARMLNEVQ